MNACFMDIEDRCGIVGQGREERSRRFGLADYALTLNTAASVAATTEKDWTRS